MGLSSRHYLVADQLYRRLCKHRLRNRTSRHIWTSRRGATYLVFVLSTSERLFLSCCERRLTIVGGVREVLLGCRLGRGELVRPRRQGLALLCGPSTSPLDRRSAPWSSHSSPASLSGCLYTCWFGVNDASRLPLLSRR